MMRAMIVAKLLNCSLLSSGSLLIVLVFKIT